MVAINVYNTDFRIDLNNIVKIIAFEDIKAYAFKKVSETSDYIYGIEDIAISKACEIADILKSQDYIIINYYDEIQKHCNEVKELKKQNKLLQHNVSMLQKKLNNKH